MCCYRILGEADLKKLLLSILLFFFTFVLISGLNFVQAQMDQLSNENSFDEQFSVDINEVDHFTNVVIFVRFQDEAAYIAPHGFSSYVTMFNGIDTVSLRDYFLEASYDQLDIYSVFATPSEEIVYYVDSEDRSYYQEYDETTNPNGYTSSNKTAREHTLLKRAIDFVEANNLIDDAVDLDVNEDGEIDCLSFLVSGEDSGWNTTLWPHKWSLSSYFDYSLGEFKTDAPVINGMNAYTYTFELLGNSVDYQYGVSVGILAHETFHLISSPDLYHYYDYKWIKAIGYWGLMESVGSIPNHMLGYMKETYGNWIQTVTEITQSGAYALYPLRTSGNNLYRISTGYSNEYVYLEYRDNVGLYEPNLPSTGLLVYRVDKDYYGNTGGYYDQYGNPKDEVFVFRPGILDTTPPIEFEDFDDEQIDEDGDISNAALSNRNPYDQMGNNTSILMFYSDGSLMDMKIYNVVERKGYVTFNVYLPPVISLESSLPLDQVENLTLVDALGLHYYVDISNVPLNGTIYYTMDGSVPNSSSTLYTGNPIEISAINNEIRIALYIDTVLMSIVSKSYQFSSTIESVHSPYGNDVHSSWYINLNQITDYDLIFDDFFEIEDGNDFLTIYDGTTSIAYTGTELLGETLSFHNSALLIEFTTNHTENDFYGFLASVFVPSALSFELVGDTVVTVDVYDDYIDLGYSLVGTMIDGYYVESIGTVNQNVTGDYMIEYLLYNPSNALVKTISRTIHVVDRFVPEIMLTGDMTLYVELGGEYTEPGATFTDNYDASGNAIVGGETVDPLVIGTYLVTYNVVDSSGNVAAEVTRTVIVQDTTPPTVSLNPSLDSIQVGADYHDYSVTTSDLTDTTISVSGVVNVEMPGTYVLTYTVEDTSGNTSNIVRIVTVYDPTPVVVFVLSNATTTISINSDYVDGTCSVTVNDVSHDCDVIENNVNTSVAGLYTVIYGYTEQGIEYSYKRYVFVYDDVRHFIVAVPLKKEEGELR